MADFGGIGAFGSAALEGYDKSLSNYAQIAQIARQREAARRAEQAQQLQNLLHGTELSSKYPGVAEQAALEPDRYGLNPETIGPGVTQARSLQAAQARLNQALANGDLEALNDPEVSRLITKDHLGVIKEMQDRKKVDAIMAGPGTPAEKARALVGLGAKVDNSLLEKAYPDYGQSAARATAAGTAEGQLPLKESLAEAEAVGRGRGELQFKGRLTQAGKEGEIRAELGADVGADVPPGGTNVGRIARERETDADRTRKLRADGTTPKPADISVALGRVNTTARNDVAMQLKHVPKGAWRELTMQEQQQVQEYLVNQRARAIAGQDPVVAGRIPEIPRPAAMDKFEGTANEGGYLDSIKRFFMGGSTPTPAVTSASPRTLRTPGPAAPVQGGWGKAEVVR